MLNRPPFASLRPSDFALNLFFVFLFVLCVSVVKNAFVLLHFRWSAPSHPLRRHPNGTAVALRETSAALAPFQRIQPGQPRRNCVNSAPCSLSPACHFGGCFA